MGLLTKFKTAANKLLEPLNTRVDSLTVEQVEMKRLGALEAVGHFEKPVFPVLNQFKDCDPSLILAEVAKHEKQFAEFAAAPRGGDVFSFANDYFTSPDAEILYAIVHLYKPRKVVEVGSGNSTLLFRQAITDAHLNTRLVSIDPHPRREIARYSDEIITESVENLGDLKRFAELKENDILFIDSSHEVKAGNDVLFLLLQVLPSLQSGVLIHIHDIFLPYEYPRDWLMEEKWNLTEHYFVHALLQDSAQYEVLWAGHYFQRSLPDFNGRFVHGRGDSAKSLWLRKR
jgi:predicted O-methyltransferase YrrM